MIFKNLFLPTLLMIVLISVLSLRAETLSLSLQDALEKAKENNYDIKITKSQLKAVKADYNSSMSVFLPQVSLSETWIKTNDPLNVFGVKLKQETVTMADFNPILLNDPDEIKNYTTKLEVQQPIINLDGFFGRGAASAGLSAMKFKLQRTENYIQFVVKMSYYKVNLLKNSKKVIEQALNTALVNQKMINDYFDEGLITKADYLMAEVFVSQLKSQKADIDNQFLNSQNELLHLLGFKKDVGLELTDTLEYYDAKFEKTNSRYPIFDRSDIKAYNFKVKASNRILNMNRMKFLPRLNAFGSFEYNDTELFGQNAENWMIGLNLHWQLFNGFKNISAATKAKAELHQAKYELEKATSQAKNEMDAALRDVDSAKNKLKLANSMVKQSEESLRIIKDRYSKGLEKTTDLLNAETTVSNARLTYLQTLFLYNVSLFKTELMFEEKIKMN